MLEKSIENYFLLIFIISLNFMKKGQVMERYKPQNNILLKIREILNYQCFYKRILYQM